MIADEQVGFHRPGRNHVRLHQGRRAEEHEQKADRPLGDYPTRARLAAVSNDVPDKGRNPHGESYENAANFVPRSIERLCPVEAYAGMRPILLASLPAFAIPIAAAAARLDPTPIATAE